MIELPEFELFLSLLEDMMLNLSSSFWMWYTSIQD